MNPGGSRARDRLGYFVAPAIAAGRAIRKICFVLWIMFLVFVTVNNPTIHTHYHGALTGQLLSGRWTWFWVIEMLWIGASFLILCALAPIALTRDRILEVLDDLKFPIWLLSTYSCICLGFMWLGNMIMSMLTANSCKHPFNTANSLLWGSACDNATLMQVGRTRTRPCCRVLPKSAHVVYDHTPCTQISRYRPAPEDVLTTDQLSISTDFWWTMIAGCMVLLGSVGLFIIVVVHWVREWQRGVIYDPNTDGDGPAKVAAYIGSAVGWASDQVKHWIPGKMAVNRKYRYKAE